MQNILHTIPVFWFRFLVLVLEKKPKNLDFLSFFTSKRSFGGYFQFNSVHQFLENKSLNML